MSKVLIINADDCNLTSGVTHAILDAHDNGVVSSTTWMVTQGEPSSQLLRDVKRRKGLGLGIHLNVTLGCPVSKGKLSSLLNREGRFKRLPEQMKAMPSLHDLTMEYSAQIELFCRIFDKLPSHLDTHHQVHDHPLFFKALLFCARRFRRPIRRSRLQLSSFGRKQSQGVKTTDYFFGDFSPAGYWRRDCLETLITNLPEGASEIMCHPGRHDSDLETLSSFTSGRQKEWDLLRSKDLRSLLAKHSILLSHFGLCYT